MMKKLNLKNSENELPNYVEIDKKLAKTGNAIYPTLVVRWNPNQRSGALTAEDLANMSEEAILKVRLPPIVSQEYAKKLELQKKEIEEKETELKLLLQEQQKLEIEKMQKLKSGTLKSIRDRMKEDNAIKAAFKKSLEEERRLREFHESMNRKNEAKRAEEERLREQMRIKQLEEFQNMRENMEELKLSDSLKLQEEQIRSLVGRKEYEECIRREKEEQRMRYLEGRRKIIEDREMVVIEREKAQKIAAIKQAAATRDTLQARVRKGNFRWHGGKYGFYDDVRAASVDWIQYEDADGKPYFYDPIYNVSQYRMPVDANIVHHIVVERAEYDAVHGTGAYDVKQAEIKYKDDFNRNGGSYDTLGNFHPATGYWDENYEWVQYEGFVNAKGKYVKYAKVEGDLSFMV